MRPQVMRHHGNATLAACQETPLPQAPEMTLRKPHTVKPRSPRRPRQSSTLGRQPALMARASLG